jgi:hypothetical protein
MVRPVQASFHAVHDAVAATIERSGGPVVAMRACDRRPMVEALIDAMGALQGARAVLRVALRMRSGVCAGRRAPGERDERGEQQRVD